MNCVRKVRRASLWKRPSIALRSESSAASAFTVSIPRIASICADW